MARVDLDQERESTMIPCNTSTEYKEALYCPVRMEHEMPHVLVRVIEAIPDISSFAAANGLDGKRTVCGGGPTLQF
jgi:hypothetical protein